MLLYWNLDSKTEFDTFQCQNFVPECCLRLLQYMIIILLNDEIYNRHARR